MDDAHVGGWTCDYHICPSEMWKTLVVCQLQKEKVHQLPKIP